MKSVNAIDQLSKYSQKREPPISDRAKRHQRVKVTMQSIINVAAKNES